jgi:hypothetical protein
MNTARPSCPDHRRRFPGRPSVPALVTYQRWAASLRCTGPVWGGLAAEAERWLWSRTWSCPGSPRSSTTGAVVHAAMAPPGRMARPTRRAGFPSWPPRSSRPWMLPAVGGVSRAMLIRSVPVFANEPVPVTDRGTWMRRRRPAPSISTAGPSGSPDSWPGCGGGARQDGHGAADRVADQRTGLDSVGAAGLSAARCHPLRRQHPGTSAGRRRPDRRGARRAGPRRRLRRLSHPRRRRLGLGFFRIGFR